LWYQLVVYTFSQGITYIDIELTLDPVPPRGNFRDFDFLIPYGI